MKLGEMGTMGGNLAGNGKRGNAGLLGEAAVNATGAPLIPPAHGSASAAPASWGIETPAKRREAEKGVHKTHQRHENLPVPLVFFVCFVDRSSRFLKSPHFAEVSDGDCRTVTGGYTH
jgi:hypothetical protein